MARGCKNSFEISCKIKGIILKRILKYFTFFITLLSLDRISKILILNYCPEQLIINKFLAFSLTVNKGVSFGLFNKTSFLMLILVITFFIILFSINTVIEYNNKKTVLGEVLILAGAISNLADRFIYKGVIDFIDFNINNWHWHTFNFADVFIVSGVVIILGRLFYGNFRKN